MNKKLDQLFNFRDNEKFKKITEIFGYILICLSVILVGCICGLSKDTMRPYVFAFLPIILLFSFSRKNDYLYMLAELITIIADIFMILLKKVDIGLPIYLFVQLTYALYFYFRDLNKKRRMGILITRGALMIISIIALIVMKKLNVRFSFASMYFINLLINIVYAIIFKDPVLIVGFILFAISDTFIGLSMLVKSTSSFAKFLASFNFVYFFYIISQTILVFNNHRNNYICHKK